MRTTWGPHGDHLRTTNELRKASHTVGKPVMIRDRRIPPLKCLVFWVKYRDPFWILIK